MQSVFGKYRICGDISTNRSLFSIDLSDPKKPKVLGKLKISGFSEYLHGYGEGMLLGLGMEADEKMER